MVTDARRYNESQVRRLCRLSLALAALGLCGAQKDLPPDLLLLARIKVRMAENLERLPNYTCLQTVERSMRRAKSGKYELLDTVRLEVAYLSGKELFSWPGAGKFDERELHDIIGGTTSTGAFALLARTVFLSRAPVFKYQGERVVSGRRSHQFEFLVRRLVSGYQIRVGKEAGITGFRGTFCADAGTLDLIRLEIEAEEIPPNLGVSEVHNAMEYGSVRIGEGRFLLPVASELRMTDMLGNDNRNRTTYSACRQYAGESAIKFEDPPPDAPAVAAEPPAPISLPAGLTIELKLEHEIAGRRLAIGDPVRTVATKEARKDGAIVLPKGAILTGRISRWEHRRAGIDYWVLGLIFDTVEFGGRRGEFHGVPQSIAGVGPQAPVMAGDARTASWGRSLGNPRIQGAPGEAVLLLRGGASSLPRNFAMVWRTE